MADKLERHVFPPLSFYMSHVYRLHEYADAYVSSCTLVVIDQLQPQADLFLAIDGGGEISDSSPDPLKCLASALALFSTLGSTSYFHGFHGQLLADFGSLPICNYDSMDTETVAFIIAMIYLISNREEQ